MDAERIVASLALRGVPGLGDRGFRLLVDEFGSPAAVLAAPRRELAERCGVSAKLAAAIDAATGARSGARKQMERTVAAGYHLVVYGGRDYPQRLSAIADPPAVLYVAGELALLSRPAVAVVGSRRCSTHGTGFAERLARELVRAGYTVVSGLAQGIDAAAHRGALDGAGPTVAVFGCGVDVVYPRRNASLAQAVRRRGAWVSEFGLGVEPNRYHFPRRNRVISGLSLGVVVVEASARSGSLITARCALEQGREVFAVPGLPGSHGARGTHGLLRQGAKLVEGVADVLEELPPLDVVAAVPGVAVDADPATVAAPPPAALRPLWAALEDVPVHIDNLAAVAGVGAAEAAAGLMELVLGGYAVEWDGKRYARPGADE